MSHHTWWIQGDDPERNVEFWNEKMWRFGTWVEAQVHCSVTQNGIDSWSTYCSVIENIPVITYCSEKTVVSKISKNSYSAKNWKIVPGHTLSGTVPEKIRHFLKRFLPFLWIMCWSVDPGSVTLTENNSVVIGFSCVCLLLISDVGRDTNGSQTESRGPRGSRPQGHDRSLILCVFQFIINQ